MLQDSTIPTICSYKRCDCDETLQNEIVTFLRFCLAVHLNTCNILNISFEKWKAEKNTHALKGRGRKSTVLKNIHTRKCEKPECASKNEKVEVDLLKQTNFCNFFSVFV